MQHIRLAAVAAAATMLAVHGGHAQETVRDTAQLPAGLAATVSRLNEAFTRLDTDAAAEFFAEDAVFESADGVLSGRETLVANWLRPTLGSLERLVVGTDAVFVIDGDTVEERARYTVYPLDAGGESQSGSYTTVWRRADDEWRVARLAVSDG